MVSDERHGMEGSHTKVGNRVYKLLWCSENRNPVFASLILFIIDSTDPNDAHFIYGDHNLIKRCRTDSISISQSQNRPQLVGIARSKGHGKRNGNRNFP